MKSKISTVVFDLGRVLVDFDHMRGCRQVSAVTGISEEELWQMFFVDRLEFSYEEGMVSTSEVLHKLRRLASREYNDVDIWRAAGDIFAAVDGMHSLVRRVKQSGLEVALLSNTNEMHWRWVSENYDVAKEFEHRILSFEVKALKPNGKIYQEALLRTNSAPHQTLFVDDLPENIAGARSLGWHGIVFTDAAQLVEAMQVFGIEL